MEDVGNFSPWHAKICFGSRKSAPDYTGSHKIGTVRSSRGTVDMPQPPRHEESQESPLCRQPPDAHSPRRSKPRCWRRCAELGMATFWPRPHGVRSDPTTRAARARRGLETGPAGGQRYRSPTGRAAGPHPVAWRAPGGARREGLGGGTRSPAAAQRRLGLAPPPCAGGREDPRPASPAIVTRCPQARDREAGVGRWPSHNPGLVAGPPHASGPHGARPRGATRRWRRGHRQYPEGAGRRTRVGGPSPRSWARGADRWSTSQPSRAGLRRGVRPMHATSHAYTRTQSEHRCRTVRAGTRALARQTLSERRQTDEHCSRRNRACGSNLRGHCISVRISCGMV
jgi:hypothetical protein